MGIDNELNKQYSYKKIKNLTDRPARLRGFFCGPEPGLLSKLGLKKSLSLSLSLIITSLGLA